MYEWSASKHFYSEDCTKEVIYRVQFNCSQCSKGQESLVCFSGMVAVDFFFC
jgi:hypothetical protein